MLIHSALRRWCPAITVQFIPLIVHIYTLHTIREHQLGFMHLAGRHYDQAKQQRGLRGGLSLSANGSSASTCKGKRQAASCGHWIAMLVQTLIERRFRQAVEHQRPETTLAPPRCKRQRDDGEPACREARRHVRAVDGLGDLHHQAALY